MNPVLFESLPGCVPYWEITRYSTTDPSLIRFVKYGRTSRLLDHVARWRGNRWDLARWCPDGKVPKDVMRQVVGELLRSAKHPENPTPRRFVSINRTCRDLGQTVDAIADDGTAWRLLASQGQWIQLPPLPAREG